MTIKINNPKPLPCTYCKTKEGYQYSDTFRMHYTSYHTQEGVYDGGSYSDGKRINQSSKAYCCNCGKLLPFKLKRERFEDTSTQ